MEQYLYRMEEVAQRTAQSRSAVYLDKQRGLLETIKVGGTRRVTHEQLERYVARLIETAEVD